MKTKKIIVSSLLASSVIVGSAVPTFAAESKPGQVSTLSLQQPTVVPVNQWIYGVFPGSRMEVTWDAVVIDTKANKGKISFQFEWPKEELEYWKEHNKDDFISFRLLGQLTNGTWSAFKGASFTMNDSSKIVNGVYTHPEITIDIDKEQKGYDWVEGTDYTGLYKLEFTNSQFITRDYRLKINFVPTASTPNPEKPSEPENPTNPEKPSEPEKPTNPEKPSEPEKPTNPEKPSEPEKPTNPEKPSEPLKKGWKFENSKWYFYKDNGELAKGWIKDKGKWYFLDGSGVMKTGWVKDNSKWYFLDGSGAMKSGWVKDNSKWYFLDGSGAMKTGWVKDNGKWYFLDGSGAMKTGWVKDNGKWYFLNGSGAMRTGWVKDNGKWYFLDGSGAMRTGWVKISNKWYYFYGSGVMASDTKIGNYKVGKDGAWIQ
jgi:glucan-binding YG repeat protein